MTVTVSDDQAQYLRFRANGLARRRGAITEIVRHCVGLQAQDPTHGTLAIGTRCDGLTAADVESARFDERSIVRTWCLRGALHFVVATDLPWLLDLFGPLFSSRGQRRLAELGFDEPDTAQAISVLTDELATHGPRTREELAARLKHEGFSFDADGQAPYHVVRRLCLEGIACETRPRDGQEAFELLEDRLTLDEQLDPETVLAELARRYLAAYEPATPADFRAWSGLYKRDVETAWGAIVESLTEVTLAGERAWTLSSPTVEPPTSDPVVRLLPMYDTYLLGHESRDLIVPPKYSRQVHPGGGIVRATVVANGAAVGTWSLNRSSSPASVSIEAFEPLDEAIRAAIADEVDHIGRFLETDLEYEITS